MDRIEEVINNKNIVISGESYAEPLPKTSLDRMLIQEETGTYLNLRQKFSYDIGGFSKYPEKTFEKNPFSTPLNQKEDCVDRHL